jgi:hypothetical protein
VQAPCELTQASYTAETDQEGRFRFDLVFPGRYLLGTNILYEYVPTSAVPRSYYPGGGTRREAFEILVEEGAKVDGLAFTLPDFGAKRRIDICVVNKAGQPVAGAKIADDILAANNDVASFGSLGDNLETDATGCLMAEGFERASYRVRAATGRNLKDLESSDDAEIPPGKGPVSIVLVLQPRPSPR